MATLARKKVNETIPDYVNMMGRWTLSAFQYNSWLTLGERYVNNGRLVDGYELLCFAHYCRGEMEQALPYIEKLVECTNNQTYQSFHVNINCLIGDSKQAVALIERYFIPYLDVVDDYIFYNSVTFLCRNLKINTLKKCMQKYKKTFNPKRLHFMNALVKKVAEDKNLIIYTGLTEDVVIEVLDVAVQQIGKIGNFDFGVQYNAYEPNDDLIITITSAQFDDEIIDELYDNWIKAMTELETDTDFNQLSRVVVNYQLGQEDKKEVA